MDRYRFKFALAAILVIVLASLFAGVLAPFSPEEQLPSEILQPPSRVHWFGTDSLGRDLFSRILYGARVSMAVAFVTAILGALLGGIYGAVAGYSGGYLDTLLMRALDLLYTVPTLLLLIFVNAVLGQGLVGILIALSLEGVMTIARLVRGQVLQKKEEDYVVAAKALGASSPAIIRRHILPNLIGPVVVTLAFLIPSNIMYEAFLSFVGLGIQPPYSSWGTLTNEGWRGLVSHPYLILFPAGTIFITMLAFHFVGEGIEQKLGGVRGQAGGIV